MTDYACRCRRSNITLMTRSNRDCVSAKYIEMSKSSQTTSAFFHVATSVATVLLNIIENRFGIKQVMVIAQRKKDIF